MDNLAPWLVENIFPHWPFFAVALILGALGVSTKRMVTKELALRSKVAWWFRATLPIHPVLAGIVIGLSNVLPASLGIDGSGGKAAYFGVSGVFSSWIWNAVQHYLEKRGLKPRRAKRTTKRIDTP